VGSECSQCRQCCRSIHCLAFAQTYCHRFIHLDPIHHDISVGSHQLLVEHGHGHAFNGHGHDADGREEPFDKVW
jgi:hypothetical protein